MGILVFQGCGLLRFRVFIGFEVCLGILGLWGLGFFGGFRV